MKNLEPKYDPSSFEKKVYDFTKYNDFFRDKSWLTKQQIDFSVILPPPNLTGMLHIGHAWNGTIQDSIVRYHQMNGKKVLWVPGLDHAGISVQTKLEAHLRKTLGSNKYQELTQAELWKYVWDWKQNYTNIIHQQWEMLGLSLDYNSEQFTFSQSLQKIVNKVFVKMYDQNLIYKAYKIVNWDCKLQTAISDIEVIHKETQSKLYYVKYKLVDSDEFLTVATSRPETIFADTAVFVNPKDKRYTQYHNKFCYNPCTNERLPILVDDYVDLKFGSAVMKCTPAHDPNDYTLSLKHNLKIKQCIDTAGKMVNVPDQFLGMSRFACRDAVIKDLDSKNLVVKIVPYKNEVGYSERTNTIIEPYLSEQWFVSVKKIAKKILEEQRNNKKPNFIPARFSSTLNTWLENIEDWCISRQLWWGHKFPVYYNKTDPNKILVSEIAPPDPQNWIQDKNVLDTWFSSALWPLVCLNWPDNKLTKTSYFPVSLLVTAYDIIFFWVARMLMQSYYLTNQICFKDVYIHGLVRDSKNRKMSKTLGNGVDPKMLIEKYGTDVLRWFLISNTNSNGQDLLYNEEKIKTSWSFINKLWNASRYLFGVSNNYIEEISISEVTGLSNLTKLDKWLLSEWNACYIAFKKHFENYNFNLATRVVSNFIWNKFCSIYLEFFKIDLTQNKNAINSKKIAKFVLVQVYQALHPFCPLVTDHLFKILSNNNEVSLLNTKFSVMNQKIVKTFNNDLVYVNLIMSILRKTRNFRTEHNILKNIGLELSIKKNDNKNNFLIQSNLNEINNYLQKLTNSIIKINDNNIKEETYKIFVDDLIFETNFVEKIDYNELLKQLKIQHNKINKEILRSKKMLENKNFVNKASSQKVQLEKEKFAKWLNEEKEITKEIINIEELLNEKTGNH